MSATDNVDYLGTAKTCVAETNGSHPVEFVKAKALLAIAAALIHIAEKGVRHEHHK